MKIWYGNTQVDIPCGYVFDIGRSVKADGSGTLPKYVRVWFVQGNKINKIEQKKILEVDTKNKIIKCESGEKFEYWDGMYYVKPK